MRFILKFLLKIALNAVILWLAARYLNGFGVIPHSFPYLEFLKVTPFVQSLIAGGIILAVLNTVLRPILKLISFPFLILTFGLFNIVINLIILYLADWYLAELTISGFTAYLFGSILIGIVNTLL